MASARGVSNVEARWKRVAELALAIILVAWPGSALGRGGGPTGCVHLCPDAWDAWVQGTGTGPCVVESDVAVVAGSYIDCEELAVEVTAGSLSTEDGTFLLHAGSLLVDNQDSHVSATCDQVVGVQGFELRIDDFVHVKGAGKLAASCASGGGNIRIVAGGDVTLEGQHAVKANGTAAGADGGAVIGRRCWGRLR